MACRLIQAVVISLTATRCIASQFLTEKTLPEGTFSQGCANALVANISCPYQVATFGQGRYYPVTSLEDACTERCTKGLAAYEQSVSSACSKSDVYRQSETDTAPAYVIPARYRYYYDKTCLRDGERWCHEIAREMAEGTMNTDRCDNCVIKQLQFIAGSPMYAGYQLRPNYTALTKSCSKTGFPLAPTSSTGPAVPSSSTGTTPTPSSCAGKTYSIKPGDTCRSISQSQGIGTAHLLVDNGLDAYCSNFPTQGNLCIARTCTTHTVGANETCRDIGREYLLTQIQLTTWNPILGQNCRHIDRSVGDSICVSPPGDTDWTPITIPSPGAATTTAATTPAPVPTNMAEGTVQRCGQYYLVEPGDYCNKIILKYSISLEDFLFLNKGVNQNCTNLYANEAYCVSPLGGIDEYPGAPGYITPGASFSDVPYSSYPKATYTPPPADASEATLLPVAQGSRKDCYAYVDGPDLQIDISGTFYTSICEAVAQSWGKSLEELEKWNPSLAAEETCTFSPEYRYCMDPYSPTETRPPPVSTSTPVPTTDPTDTSTTTTTTTAGGGPPGPTQAGIPSNCNKWHLVTGGETCSTVVAKYHITLAQFYKWNPAVKNDCVEGFWGGTAYCVGVAK